MVKHLIRLPDGRELSSGAAGAAIRELELTWGVNSGTELTLGSVCAAMAEVRIMDGTSVFPIRPGEEFSVWQRDEEETLLGVFIADEVERCGAGAYRLTGFDKISLLDKPIDHLLDGLTQWPYSLSQLLLVVSQACGVEVSLEGLPFGDYLIPQFRTSGVTGRRLFQWAGELTGRFCRATPEGTLEFGWYTPTDRQILPASAAEAVGFFAGSLTCADAPVLPVAKVQIRQNAEDVGTVYPDIGEANTYIIEGNPLLVTEDGETLLPIAQHLYDQLREFSYTPCRVSVPASTLHQAGQIVSLTDREGNPVRLPVMTKTRTGQRDTLESVGSHSRQSVRAVNHQSYQALNGKVLNLQTDVSGLRAENRDMEGKLSSVQLDVEGIRTEVAQQKNSTSSIRRELTQVSQTAQDVSVQVQNILDNGVERVSTSTGYTFDKNGLHIRQQGEEMANRLDHTGMYVERAGDVLLQVNASGVDAKDVTVKNYLVIGDHARFEDYRDGVACFYL